MTSPDRDSELEAFAARSTELRRLSGHGNAPEPPPELDRLVLAKAREAISSPVTLRTNRAPRWALPVGVAAAVLLGLAVLFNVELARLSGPGLTQGSAQGGASSTPAPRARSAYGEPKSLSVPYAAAARKPEAVTGAPADVTGAPAAVASQADRATPRDAKTWLREIQRLRAAGRIAEAERELEAFHKAFPALAGPSAAEPRAPAQ